MRRVLAVEDDVEDGVHPAAAREHTTKLALRNRDRMGRVPAPVEDARNEAATAQPAGLTRPCVLARQDFELDPFSGHFGPAV